MRVTDSRPEAAAAHVPAALPVIRPESAGHARTAGLKVARLALVSGTGEPRITQAELAWLVPVVVVCLVAIIVSPAWQVPEIAAIFILLAWQASRRIAAQDKARFHAESQRLIGVQRQFLQDASHQLRTPITIALGHAELLATAQGSGQQRDINVVVSELQRLKKLSERLLLVAAAENPDFGVREPAEIDMIVAEVFLRWQAVAPRGWQLGRLDPVTAAVDSERLRLALDALVENAVRHTGPPDEITLSVQSKDFARSVAIAVADTGSGIAEAELPHVFERFRTSGARGSQSGGGTGLGLALVRAVATGHGGDVIVRSVQGAGSTFELVLPVAQVPAARSLHGPAGAPPSGAK